VTREVCENLKTALADYAGPVLFVSRSDSTLRGHYPVETDVMNAVLGPFDATLLTPAFFEGGRITRDSTHYLVVDGKPVPTHETNSRAIRCSATAPRFCRLCGGKNRRPRCRQGCGTPDARRPAGRQDRRLARRAA